MSYTMQWNYGEVMAANPHFKQEDIDELRRWVQSEEAPSNVPKDLSESMLLCFHNACNWIINDTKKCVKSYFSCKEKTSEIFDNRNLNQQSLQNQTQTVQFGVSPVRTDDNQSVIFSGLSDPNLDKFNFNASFKMLFMTSDRCIMEQGPVNGSIFFIDLKHMKLGHLTKINFISLAKCFTYIQEGLPSRVTRINVMNIVPFMNKVLAVVKPFLHKELYSIIHLYESDIDYSKFHGEVVPKRCLPCEYQGDLPGLEILDRDNRRRLLEMAGIFDDEEIHRYHYYKKERKTKYKEEFKFEDLNID